MSRGVKGEVLWAKPSNRPAGLPIGRPRGAKALGLRYESSVAKALPLARHGLWWEFEDASGWRCCQTDLVLMGARSTLVLEVKYSYTPEAWEQLEKLYSPVLRIALGLPVLGVQICKNLRDWKGPVVSDLKSAISLAKQEGFVLLHWTGIGPLGIGGL